MIVQELDALRPREQVIADLIMQQYPELMDNLGKHMNGELDLPDDLTVKVTNEIEVEKELRDTYMAAARENISKERLDTAYNAAQCPLGEKMKIMNLCFPVIACSESAVLQKHMVIDLASSLMIEVSLVTKDYKQWWKKNHKHKSFPDAPAQNAVRDIIKHTHNNS